MCSETTAGIFEGAQDCLPKGTFCGGDEIPASTFHGGDEIPAGTFHSAKRLAGDPAGDK